MMRDSIPLALLVQLIALPLVGACGVPVHEVARAVSPDKSKIALVFQEEPRPLIQTDTFVYIKPLVRKLNKRSDLVFQGGDMSGRGFGPVNIQWKANRALVVAFCSGRTSIYRNLWGDWQIKPDDEVAVGLYVEPEGDWPSNIPSDRRAGPPPCT
jgi:hypothetical protein